MSRSLFLSTSLAFVCVVFLMCPSAMAEPIAVMVHPSNPIDGVSSLEIAKIFRGQRLLWPDGQRIFLVHPEASSGVYRQFVSLMLDPTGNKSGDSNAAGSTSRGISPQTSFAISKLISQMPNSIGYAGWSSVEGAANIKILKVDGFLPEDSGYRLKE